ncbi:MAG TPA: heme-binding domain-containing protein [Pyrinomonadaceae bacterium]|nr:heme-binding domain-containing protein [Pyrinomonadaceae bacterium]
MRIVLRILKWIAIILFVVFVGIQFVRRALTNPPVDESQTIVARANVPPDVAAILERSCRDCHSNKTVWPWYTHVAPVSWWLKSHVDNGRKDLNLSEWGKLPRDRQDRKLRQMCDEVQDGNMPLASYLPMHPTAKLSDQDKRTLCAWTDQEREKVSQ